MRLFDVCLSLSEQAAESIDVPVIPEALAPVWHHFDIIYVIKEAIYVRQIKISWSGNAVINVILICFKTNVILKTTSAISNKKS